MTVGSLDGEGTAVTAPCHQPCRHTRHGCCSEIPMKTRALSAVGGLLPVPQCRPKSTTPVRQPFSTTHRQRCFKFELPSKPEAATCSHAFATSEQHPFNKRRLSLLQLALSVPSIFRQQHSRARGRLRPTGTQNVMACTQRTADNRFSKKYANNSLSPLLPATAGYRARRYAGRTCCMILRL